MNKLLMYYVNHECGHLQQGIVTRYGHTYLKLSGYDIDDSYVWIKRRESDLICEDLFAGIYTKNTLTAVYYHTGTVHAEPSTNLSPPESTIPPPEFRTAALATEKISPPKTGKTLILKV